MMLWLKSTAFCLLAWTACAVEERTTLLGSSEQLVSAFHKWAEFHDKQYESHDEKMIRMQIWAENDGEFEY